MCQSWPIIKYTLVVASALTFVVISVQRAGILFFQDKVERLFSSKINIVLVVLCWTICLASFSSLHSDGKVTRVSYTQDCELVHKNYPESGPDPVEPVLLVYFSILFLVLLISNTAMMIKIKMETNNNDKRRKEHIFIFMMLISFSAWTLFHLPW